jgi:hypothetical protein
VAGHHNIASERRILFQHSLNSSNNWLHFKLSLNLAELENTESGSLWINDINTGQEYGIPI